MKAQAGNQPVCRCLPSLGTE